MKTFSAMSVPDMILTKDSYLLKLAVIKQRIDQDHLLDESQIQKLKKEATRLQNLIDAIDADLLSE